MILRTLDAEALRARRGRSFAPSLRSASFPTERLPTAARRVSEGRSESPEPCPTAASGAAPIETTLSIPGSPEFLQLASSRLHALMQCSQTPAPPLQVRLCSCNVAFQLAGICLITGDVLAEHSGPVSDGVDGRLRRRDVRLLTCRSWAARIVARSSACRIVAWSRWAS